MEFCPRSQRESGQILDSVSLRIDNEIILPTLVTIEPSGGIETLLAGVKPARSWPFVSLVRLEIDRLVANNCTAQASWQQE